MQKLGNILLIEDNATTAALLTQCLPCFRVETAGTISQLAEALFKHRESPYSAIVLDLVLPDGYGPSLVSNVRNRVQNTWPETRIPIVVLTGLSPVEAPTVTIHRSGADTVLRKPVSPDELRAALIEAISERITEERYGPTERFIEQAISDSKQNIVPTLRGQ